MRTLRTFRSAVLLLSCLIGSPALADDSPLPRVGRVSAVDGTVALRPAGGEWADSGVNDPIAVGLDAAVADNFVAWWRSAAGQDADPPALHHVSAEMTGYEALDGNGSWETVAGYGAVWFAQTAADDWAPYRNGHWRCIAPWGWTWIDDMQWGFAPSHYGRWARVRQADPLDPSDAGSERWGWVPGRLVAPPVYVPAAVAFLGTAGVGISYPDAVGPAVAWFPLAPGEAYWPAYTSDLDMIRRINDGAVPDFSAIGGGVIPGTAASTPTDQVRGLKAHGQPASEPPSGIVNGDYRNRRDARIVPRAVFTAGRPVASSLLQLPERRLDNAPLLAGSPQIAPAAPHAAMVASVPAASRRLAGAMRTLARILAPVGRANAAAAATLARPADARAATLALARHSRWPGAHPHLARPHLLAATTPRGAHPRLHFAAAHRATLR